MPKNVDRWIVEGFDGSRPLTGNTRQTLVASQFTEKAIVEILQRLLVRHIPEADIADCSRRRNSQFYNPVLEPRISQNKRPIIEVGDDPHYVASFWKAGEEDH